MIWFFCLRGSESHVCHGTGSEPCSLQIGEVKEELEGKSSCLSDFLSLGLNSQGCILLSLTICVPFLFFLAHILQKSHCSWALCNVLNFAQKHLWKRAHEK